MTYFVEQDRISAGGTVTIRPPLTAMWKVENIYVSNVTFSVVAITTENSNAGLTIATTIDSQLVNQNFVIDYYNYLTLVNGSTVGVNYVYNGQIL